jgi:Ran GTPase-activating protein (RanGAP) involved in mRNA processing and transport
LASINLKYNGFDAAAAKVLAPAICNSHLKSIDLSHNQLRAQGAKALALAIKSLDSINLQLTGLDPVSAQALVNEGAFSSLTSIDLSNNYICGIYWSPTNPNVEGTYTDDGIRAIASAIRDSPSLTFINLSGNIPPGSDKGSAFAEALVDGGAFKGSLTSIDLSFNSLEKGSTDGITAIAGALFASSSLTSIDLVQNDLDAAGAQALVDGGAFSGSLTSINLAQNDLDAAAAEVLAPAIRESRLTSINLAQNDLGAAAVQVLVPAIRDSRLTSVDLRQDFDDSVQIPGINHLLVRYT